jgi:hypothetical protein
MPGDPYGGSGDALNDTNSIGPQELLPGGGGSFAGVNVNGQNATYRNLVAAGQAVLAALVRVRAALGGDADCDAWLKSGIAQDQKTFNGYMNVLASGAMGQAEITQNGGGTLNASTKDPAVNYQIVIGTTGAFFPGANVGVGYGNQFDKQIASLVPGSRAAQNFILIHEIAHYLNIPGFVPNDAAKAAQAANNDQVWSHCSKAITGAEAM